MNDKPVLKIGTVVYDYTSNYQSGKIICVYYRRSRFKPINYGIRWDNQIPSDETVTIWYENHAYNGLEKPEQLA